MGKLVFGGVLLLVSFFLMIARSSAAGGKSSGLLRVFAAVFSTVGLLFILGALVVVDSRRKGIWTTHPSRGRHTYPEPDA